MSKGECVTGRNEFVICTLVVITNSKDLTYYYCIAYLSRLEMTASVEPKSCASLTTTNKEPLGSCPISNYIRLSFPRSSQNRTRFPTQ
jgi:hypothetical protein